jgi:hypothetical protein
MCDHHSTVATANHFTNRANDDTPEVGVCFSSEIAIIGGSFAPGQILNFGRLDYITDYNDELHPLKEILLEDESPASYPL